MGAVAKTQQKSAFDVIKGYFLDFKVLKDCPMEYWTIQAINLLDCLAYFSFLNIAVVFLSETMGFSDVRAGYVFTIFTAAVTLMLFISGFITDSLGIRKSLYLTMALLLLISRGGIVLCGFYPDMPYRSTLMWPLFLLLAPGCAMIQTIFQAAIRRYTSGRARSAGFSMWYLVMNIGAALGGFAIDFVRLTMKLDNTWIMNIGVITAVLCTILTFLFIRNELQVLDPGEKSEEEKPRERKVPWQILKEVVSQSVFWRFIVLVSCLIGVRAVFLYMALLQPKYWLRVIGDQAPMGLFQAINPILIVVGLILFIPIANKFNIYKMLIFGGVISSISMLALVAPWRWFSGDMAAAYTTMTVIQLVILSVGEIIWSPKIQEYTAAVAPPGQEGSYFGMSMVPYFAAKTFIGLLSGHMLLRFCPEGIKPEIAAGTLPFWRTPEAMWLILTAFALLGLVVAFVFKGWLTRGVNLDPTPEAPIAH